MKRFASFALALLLLVNITACAGEGAPPVRSSSGAGGDGDGPDSAAAAVELNCAAFCSTETEENIWNSLNERFMEEYPQYTVNFEYAPTAAPEEYIKSKIAAGDFPDTMWVFQPALLIDGGIIQEMPSELEELLLTPEAFKVGGKLYTMPLWSGALGLWYNKEIFEQAGVTELPEMWPDFIDTCEKLLAIGVEPIGMSAKEGWYIAGMFNFLWAPATYGAELHWPAMRNAGEVSFNNETTRRSLEQFGETIPYWQMGALSASYDEVKSLFFSGKVAMLGNGGQYNAGEINSGEVTPQFEIGYLAMPQDSASQRRINTFSDNMFVISSEVRGEKLEGVTEYLKYFYSQGVYPDFLTANMAMPTVKGFDENGARVEHETARIMLDELSRAMADLGTVPHAHAAQGDDMWPAGCREMSEKICQEIAAGNTDLDKLMDLMDEQWDKGLEQAGQQ